MKSNIITILFTLIFLSEPSAHALVADPDGGDNSSGGSEETCELIAVPVPDGVPVLMWVGDCPDLGGGGATGGQVGGG